MNHRVSISRDTTAVTFGWPANWAIALFGLSLRQNGILAMPDGHVPCSFELANALKRLERGFLCFYAFRSFSLGNPLSWFVCFSSSDEFFFLFDELPLMNFL